MFNFLLTEEEKKLKQEVKRFVKEEVPSSLIRAMDADEVKYRKSLLKVWQPTTSSAFAFPKNGEAGE